MFIVLALPRSRTFWLSKALTYGDFSCGHEEARYLRTMEDARIWLDQDYRGSCETAAAPFWRLAEKINPKLRVVIVRRPVSEVVESLMRFNARGIHFDRALLTRNMKRIDAKLDQIEARVPKVLSVRFDDLDNLKTAEKIFTHCLPYKFDAVWWSTLASQNLQCDLRAMMRYALAYQKPIERMGEIAAHMIKQDMVCRVPRSTGNVTFQQEPFATWIKDAEALFAEHCVEIGDPPSEWKKKNIPLMQKLYDAGALHITTARSNGRMFGYLAAVLNPSLEAQNLLSGVHTTFFVSKDMPGIGLRLQRASVAALRQKGAGEVFFHAGVRGSGPRMDTLYKRLGAREFGKLYRMQFDEVR